MVLMERAPSPPAVVPNVAPRSRAQLLFVELWTRFLALYFRLYHRLRVEGVEHVPARGPLLVIFNHSSNLDIFAIQSIRRHHLDTLCPAKKELFAPAWRAWFIQAIGGFPLDREALDLSAVRAMIRLLRQGRILIVAPEGTRSRTGRLDAFKPEIAKLAIMTGTPILPIGIRGTHEALPPGAVVPRPARIYLCVGDVFDLSPFYGRRLSAGDLAQAAEKMRERVASLIDPAQL